MQKDWNSLENKIDRERFDHVKTRLAMQLQDAREWRDVCLEYFGRFADPNESGKEINDDDG